MGTITLDITRSEVAERLLRLNGLSYSLDAYPMFRGIFNSPWPRRLMRSGRQVSKTTTMAADLVVSVVEEPYSQCLYCNSSQAQTRSFSNSKLSPFLHQSPLIYHGFMEGRDIIDNVYEKRLANFSSIEMSYFSDVADRVRGKSARSLYMDEVQDMLYDAMIDAEECLSAAAQPKIMYAGTSKSTITPLEFFWGHSTQKEWVIKCQGCGKYNRMSKGNIGRKGLICRSCGHELNTYDGLWASFASDKVKPIIDGYWIPQIVMPMHCCSESKWDRLLEKLETYPEVKFDNEVMGLPSGEGESPITEEMLRSICLENMPMIEGKDKRTTANADYICAGIDWGGGGRMGTSRTTLHVYKVTLNPLQYTCIFGKIYDEGEPTRHVADIARIVKKFGCIYTFGDHGGGNFAMSQLRSMVPPTMMVIPVMYTESQNPLRWDDKGKHYVASRTLVIDEFFSDMKRGYIKAFNWNAFEPFARDILNIRQVYIGEEAGRPQRVWRHRPSDPDDSLHSMVFGWIACRVLSNRANMYAAAYEEIKK